MNITDLFTNNNQTGINSGMTPQQTDMLNSLIQSPMWQQMISGQQNQPQPLQQPQSKSGGKIASLLSIL